MNKKITFAEFCKKYSGRLSAGAAAIGAVVMATALIVTGNRKKAVDEFGLEGVISEE